MPRWRQLLSAWSPFLDSSLSLSGYSPQDFVCIPQASCRGPRGPGSASAGQSWGRSLSASLCRRDPIETPPGLRSCTVTIPTAQVNCSPETAPAAPGPLGPTFVPRLASCCCSSGHVAFCPLVLSQDSGLLPVPLLYFPPRKGSRRSALFADSRGHSGRISSVLAGRT